MISGAWRLPVLEAREVLAAASHLAGKPCELDERTTEQRLATDHQFHALTARDGGCRWPGCDIPATWCDVDHLIPAHAGGPTLLENLVLWCRHHHHDKHRPGVTVLGDAHHLHLRLADGTTLFCPPHAAAHARPAPAAA